MVAFPGVNYNVVANGDHDSDGNPAFVVAEPATVGCELKNSTDDGDKSLRQSKDAYFDDQQDILQMFDYDREGLHSYWVYNNYARRVDNVLPVLSVLLFFFGILLIFPFFWYAVLCFAFSLISYGSGELGFSHVLLLQMIRDSKVAPYTAATRSGIKHVQPPSRKGPGGEVFIPFCLVQNVEVQMRASYRGPCVAEVQVFVENLNDASIVVSGIPRFQPNYSTEPRKTIILGIKGLREPYQFKRLVMAKASEGAASRF